MRSRRLSGAYAPSRPASRRLEGYATRGSASVLHLAAQPRVERVAEPVTQKIEAEHGDHDSEAGNGRDVGGDEEEVAAARDHQPPRGRGRRDAETEEGQRGLDEDGVGHEERR